MPLETELRYFEDHRAEWVRLYPGKFVVIKGEVLVGPYDTNEAAYNAGVAKFGTEGFLVKQVVEKDTPSQAPALFAGPFSAAD